MRTIRDLTGALKCEPESIATWIESAASESIAALAHAQPEPAKPARKEPPSKLPRPSTLAQRAAAERKAKIPRRTLAAGGGAVEVIGFDRLYEIDAAFGAHKDARYGVEGAIAEHRAIPRYVEPILDVESGIGAQFLIVRKVAREPLYLSIFTRSAEHTRALMNAERDGRAIACACRVVVARPRGEWKGFFIFEKQPKPHPWALLVEELLP